MYKGWLILRTDDKGLCGSDPVGPLYEFGKQLGV
jgi:hypothetical protein